MDFDAASFWKRTNELIKKRKTKQEVIAASCGINYQTFRGWVTRETYPAGDETYRIAQALGVSVEFLVTGRETLERSSNAEFVQNIRTLLNQALEETDRIR
jgi:transcriptional regulator with XRE-family HTH domain